jgi:signal transduction histidine kinase
VDLAPDVSLHLYRIAQEAVRNALKHAGASEIVLSLEVQKGLLHLRVRDNGRGLKEADRLRGGMGLLNLQYRAKALGAELHFESEPSQGTTVTCLLPVDPRAVAGAPAPVERTPQLQLF